VAKPERADHPFSSGAEDRPARRRIRPERRFAFTLGRDVSLQRSGQVSGRQLCPAADRRAELISADALPGGARDAGGEAVRAAIVP